MIKKETRGLAMAITAMIGLAGCATVPSSQAVSVAPADPIEGSLVPVYNPPPGTPFHCVGTPVAITLYSVPGDPLGFPRLGIVTAPVATMGNRRGDWLLVVTHSGEIGWINDPQEEPFGQVNPGAWCHVHQDAQGRIVFNYRYFHGSL